MSFRFAAVPPTCLSSRLARTRLQSCSLKSYALVANKSSIAVARHKISIQETLKEPTYKRNIHSEPSKLPDGDLDIYEVSVGILPAETTRSRQHLNRGEELIPHQLAPSNGQPQNNARNLWLDDWNLTWERLHVELVESRSQKLKSMRDIWHDRREFARFFIDNLNASELKEKWKKLTGLQKGATLPRLLAGSLAESAAQTLFVLSNVNIQSSFNFRVRMQCLRHIHLMYIHELSPGSEARRCFEAEIAILRDVKRWPKHDIPIPHLDTLLTWSDPEQCDAIIEAYQKTYPFAQPASLMPVIMSYIKHGNIEAAFERFKQLPEHLIRETTGFAATLRELLLKHDTVTKTDMGSNFKFLPQVLALGIEPDASLHNAVIEAALANEVPDVAWDLYHHLKSSELEIKPRTHLVLLKDAFQRGQVEAVNNVMTSIHENQNLIKDRYLIAYSMNIVRVVCYFERKAPPEESLSHILALYDRAYNRAPLYQLGILSENNQVEENDILPKPKPDSLAFTIWSFVLVQYSTEVVDMLWSWMKKLIAKKEIDIIAVAELDIVYNGLILFYSRTPQGMIRAMQVLQYMLRSSLCGPSERTWSLLLCGFLKYGRYREAKDLLDVMRVRGVKLQQLSQEHSPSNSAILKAMEADIEAMEERVMPAELAQVMASSSSLHPLHYASEASTAEVNSLGLPKTWRGFTDMHPSGVHGRTSANIDH